MQVSEELLGKHFRNNCFRNVLLLFSPSLNIPSNDYSGSTSFKIDWFDLLAVQETLKSLLQHYSLKASVLQLSAFFMVQL